LQKSFFFVFYVIVLIFKFIENNLFTLDSLDCIGLLVAHVRQSTKAWGGTKYLFAMVTRCCKSGSTYSRVTIL
jgi:hypothetical protein